MEEERGGYEQESGGGRGCGAGMRWHLNVLIVEIIRALSLEKAVGAEKRVLWLLVQDYDMQDARPGCQQRACALGRLCSGEFRGVGSMLERARNIAF